MSYRVLYTKEARDDLQRLFRHLLERSPASARRARDKVRKAMELLKEFPFSCRVADERDPLLRELVIPFGGSGFVALFKII